MDYKNSMNLIERTKVYIKERADKIRNGGVNCISSPFIRFRQEFIGTEQKKYYIVTANTKVGKTQFANFLFVFNNVIYAYEHPDQIRLKIFYYALEETPEDITLRFMSFLLNKYANIRISPSDLASSANVPLDDKVLQALELPQIKNLLDFYDSHVEFSPTRNPTGINKEVRNFMLANGTVHTKKVVVKDEYGRSKEVDKFDYYEPNDPDLYTLVIVDHASLLQLEQGLTDKTKIDKMSEYFVELRNKYFVSPVLIQQQTADRESLDAFKENKLRPTAQGLADSKYTGRDCNCLIGVFNPFKHELPDYKKYDITKLQDNARFVEIIHNRGGSCGGIVGLYFDGVTCNWAELPKPDDYTALNKLYAFLQHQRQSQPSKSFFMFTIKKWLRSCFN